MHAAYDAVSVITNQQQTCAIECMTAYGDKLIIGTRNGLALVYLLKPQGGSSFDISLDKTIKSFAKKPVVQMEAVPELDILISLSDNSLSVHELSSLTLLKDATNSLNESKGNATLFNLELQVLTSLDGNITYNLLLCIAVRKKIQVYYWKAGSFQSFCSEMVIPESPKAICLCKDTVCVGFKREYSLLNLTNGSLSELFPTGKSLEPLIARFGEDKMVLTKDNMSIIINNAGNAAHKHGFPWTDSPIGVVYREPYLIGVLPRLVEVRTIDPRVLIQTIDLDKPRFMCHSRDGAFYVGSPTNVWRLVFVSLERQIKQLIDKKEFELCLKLCELEGCASDRLQEIKNLYAFELFFNKKYEESMKMFAELITDPSNVIGLYPGLLPQDYKDKLRFPGALPRLDGKELEEALLALIEYLTSKRTELQKVPEVSSPLNLKPIVDGSNTVKNKKQLNQIIDTTLLKCYLEVNDALVAPLLRQENSCHIEESETELNKRKKHDELLILYKSKGLHDKALNMLKNLSLNMASPSTFRGVERTVKYLQMLGSSHLETIQVHSDWVIKMEPDQGLLIFTEDLSEVENLPRKQVLLFLEKYRNNKKLTIPYLRHIIFEWHEKGEEFHDRLVNAYREEITPQLVNYVQSLPDGQLPAPAGEEGGELGKLRSDLLDFLTISNYYRAERLIKDFPFEYFYEERVILLGKQGHHKQALFICVNILRDAGKAEDYCRQHYKPNNSRASDVYLHLFGYFIKPTDGVTDARLLYGSKSLQAVKPDPESALRILQQHSAKLDCLKVLDLLPDNFPLHHVFPFLERVLEKKETEKRHIKVMKSLLHTEKLAVECSKMNTQSVKFMVTDRNTCYVCENKISTSSFARHADGRLAHFSCLP